MISSSHKYSTHLLDRDMGMQSDGSRHGWIIEDACGDAQWVGNIFFLSRNVDVNEQLTTSNAYVINWNGYCGKHLIRQVDYLQHKNSKRNLSLTTLNEYSAYIY